MLISRKKTDTYSDRQTSNGTQVCFIHSDKAQKCALSLCINAGHYNDPDDCLGLAHLFEHMMFSSSEKHAKANDLHQFLSQNRGFINAWTSSEHINFHFDASQRIFIQACKSFVELITDPSYEAESIQNEINVIDAEFKMRLIDDVRRLGEIHKETVNANHPFSRFSIGHKGSLGTLGISKIQVLLKQFHDQFIRPSALKIVVICPQSNCSVTQGKFETQLLDIFNCFSESPTSDQAHFKIKGYEQALYLKPHLQKLIRVKPVKQSTTAIVSYVLPNIDELTQFKPLLMLSHMLEDESERGLLNYLRSTNWVYSLSASGGLSGPSYQEFNINLQLSPEGLKHITSILGVIDAFISQFRHTNLEAWRWQEKAAQLSLQAIHQDYIPAIDLASSISTRLHSESFAHILSSDALITLTEQGGLDANTALQNVLNHCSIEFCRVFVITKPCAHNKISKHYKAEYSLETLEFKRDFDIPKFVLSSVNPFMPNQIDAVQNKTNVYELSRVDAPTTALYHANDTRLSPSKGDIYISIEHPSMVGSVNSFITKKLWLASLNKHLACKFAMAEYASLNFNLYGNQSGISLHFSGCIDKQMLLATNVLEELKQFSCTSRLLDLAKHEMFNSLKNALLNKPVNQLFFEINHYLQESTYAHHQVLNKINTISQDKIKSSVTEYWNFPFIEALCVGDFDDIELKRFASDISLIMPNRSSRPKAKSSAITLQKKLQTSRVHIAQEEHAAICYFQAPNTSLHDAALMVMLEKLLAAMLFDGLRNKRKLGYLIGCGYMPINHHPGLAIYVQSPNVASSEIIEHIMDELSQIIDNTKLSETRVSDLKVTLAEQLHTPFTNQSQFAQSQWLKLDRYSSDAENGLNDEIMKLSMQDINSALTDLISLKQYKRLDLVSYQ